jgi:hypothetical protein
MSKREMRARLAALSFTEKIKILERLRDRSLALAASGMRPKAATNPGKSEDEKQPLRKGEK